MKTPRVVSATRFIPATPEVIFNLLADPREHARFDGSGTLQEVQSAPARLSKGATFTMGMKIGRRYHTKNTVVVFEENRAIAWHHFAQFVWRYDLVPADGGTTLTESFDYSKPWGRLIERFGWPERNRTSIEATLRRIEEVVTSPS